MSDVVLIGRDWTTRALVRAQLLEEGVDVEAHETAAEAVEVFKTPELLPALLVADLSSSANPEGEIELLASFAQHRPVWIIASKTVVLPKNLQDRGFETILFKPLDAGELVEQIKRRLQKK